MQSSWLPPEWSLMPECQQITQYLRTRHVIVSTWVTLVKGGGDQTPTFPCIEQLTSSRHIAGRSWRTDYWSCGTCSREAILFFGWLSCKEGLPLGGARDVGFSLMGPTSWAGRADQVEVTVSTMQEGHCAIAEAVIEKRTKQGAQDIPIEWWRSLRPPSLYMISKIDVRSGRGCSWKGEQKGQCG